MTLPWWLSGKESACQWRFDPWVGKILWRRKCQPTLAFLPGKSHRQRSLVGYHPLGCKVRHDLAAKLQELEGGFFFFSHVYWVPLVTKHPVNIPKEITQKTNQSFSSWLKLTVNKYMIQLLERRDSEYFVLCAFLSHISGCGHLLQYCFDHWSCLEKQALAPSDTTFSWFPALVFRLLNEIYLILLLYFI